MVARRQLLPNTVLDIAVSAVEGAVQAVPEWVRNISLEAKFVRAGGGTNTKVWVQTSLDGGVTWFDIACFAFLTTTANKLHALRLDVPTVMTPATVPASATLADDTVLNGIWGDKIRTLLTTTGTYTGASSIEVHAVLHN